MPRAVLDLQDVADLRAVQGQWRFALGYVPGEPNEGFVSQIAGSPARLPDYDDSGWGVCHDLTQGQSRGFTFAWYRITVRLPEMVQGQDIRGARCLFETCIDDYGEVWINGECDRERGAIQGFNAPQRVLITTDPQPGQRYTIALLAANGPLAQPGGTVFVRYVFLAFEWPTPVP
jgi:gluconolactonase